MDPQPDRSETAAPDAPSRGRRAFVPGVVLGVLCLGWGSSVVAAWLWFRWVELPRIGEGAYVSVAPLLPAYPAIAVAGLAILVLSLRRGGRRPPSTEPGR